MPTSKNFPEVKKKLAYYFDRNTDSVDLYEDHVPTINSLEIQVD